MEDFVVHQSEAYGQSRKVIFCPFLRVSCIAGFCPGPDSFLSVDQLTL